MIFNQLTSYIEDVLKSYILNEILLVAISMLKSSLLLAYRGGFLCIKLHCQWLEVTACVQGVFAWRNLK